MAAEVDFRIVDIEQYRSGVNAANDKAAELARHLDYERNEARSKADGILRKVDNILMTMREDENAARDVRSHNEGVLAQYEQLLIQLENRYRELEQQYREAYAAYRRACEEETRLHNTTIKSTGDPDADHRAEQARAAAQAAAEKEVRATWRLVSQIKQEMEQVRRNIETTKRNIETTKNTINQLNQFISNIQSERTNVEQYRDRLKHDVQTMNDRTRQFLDTCRSCRDCLTKCATGAERGIQYGRQVCSCLDPDGSAGDHNTCVIKFTDTSALSSFAQSLTNNCDDFDDAYNTIQNKAHQSNRIMQDSVISESTKGMFELGSRCDHEISQIRNKARNCRDAKHELDSYYNLQHIF